MLPTRTCASSPPPTYEIPRRLMPDCAQLPDPPGPLSVPPQLEVLIPEVPVINFGCFLPTMTTELQSTESTTSMQNQVTSKDGDACQFNLHTILKLPKFVVDPIHNPPCGFFGADVSTSFGKYLPGADGVTPPAQMPYATTTLSNYAVSAKPLTVANANTKFGAKIIAGRYAIRGTIDAKCDHYVMRCTQPALTYAFVWTPPGFGTSNGVIDNFCNSQKAMMLALAGGGVGIPYYEYVRFNQLGAAQFDIFAVNGGGTRTLLFHNASVSNANAYGDPSFNSWCNVDAIPGLQIKVDAQLDASATTPGACYPIALAVGDEIDVAVCKDDSEPCNRHLSIDFVFPAMLGDPRVQMHPTLLGAVYENQRNHFELVNATVQSSGSVGLNAQYNAEIFDAEGASLGVYTAVNHTGRILVSGERVAVWLPDSNPEVTGSDPLAGRIPPGGLITPPLAASSGAVASDPTQVSYPDWTAVYRTPGGWQLLNDKLSAPAMCGIVMNQTVMVLGEIPHDGLQGTIYYAGVGDGSISTVPPVPVTESDPTNEQWIRVLGVQVTDKMALVRPDIIPLRAIPTAMCQGTHNYTYRLARIGNF